MTSGDSRISGAGKKRLRRGCLWTLIVFAIGFYAGLVATKRALTGPYWIRHFAGITLPVVNPPAAPPVNPTVPNSGPVQQNSGAVGAPHTGQANSAPPGSGVQQDPNAASPAPPTTGQTHSVSSPPLPQTPPEGGWIVGVWDITDELHPVGGEPSTVSSEYVFDVGGTGEFDTNGSKLYDLHWENAGDYILIDFVMDTEGEQNLKVKMKYSINADHSLLTLAPEGKKDPRGTMYSVGPGVYHRKK